MRVGGIQARRVGEKLDEHEVGQVPRDPRLPVPALVEREKMEGAAIGRALDKGGMAENQGEDAEPMRALRLVALGEQVGEPGNIEQAREVDLEIFFGARFGALVVEPPQPAIGQDAPLDAAVGERLGARQVAEDLARRDLALVVALPACLWSRGRAGGPSACSRRSPRRGGKPCPSRSRRTRLRLASASGSSSMSGTSERPLRAARGWTIQMSRCQPKASRTRKIRSCSVCASSGEA